MHYICQNIPYAIEQISLIFFRPHRYPNFMNYQNCAERLRKFPGSFWNPLSGKHQRSFGRARSAQRYPASKSHWIDVIARKGQRLRFRKRLNHGNFQFELSEQLGSGKKPLFGLAMVLACASHRPLAAPMRRNA